MKRPIIIIFFFFFLSVVLTLVFFWGIDKRHFIYMGDQFFRFNYFEAFVNSFFMRKPENLGVLNGWQFMTQFWDSLYYLFVYSFHISFITAERILFFTVLFFSFICSYFGFKKLNELFTLEVDMWKLFLITIWYCINPYTVILWHGGVYNIGSALTYTLAPLILYFIHQTCFTRTNIRNVLICATLLYMASFTFWLFAPLLFFLILYVLFYLLLHKKLIFQFTKNILLLIPLYFLLASPIIFSIIYEYSHTQGNNNATFTPTFTNQMGGVRFQLYMWFSWGIYNVWNPRSLFSYGSYYFSPWYLVPTKLLYVFVFFGGLQVFIKQWKLLRKSKQKKLTVFLTPKIKMGVIFLLIFLLAAFFAKGPQPPLGQVFLYLYNHVPLFSVFRTPDIRFGFPMIFSLTLMLLLISKEYKRYLFLIGLGLILFFQNLPFFTGVAIRGESVKNKYYNRVLYIPNDYVQIAGFLNNDYGSGYVLPIPPMGYGHFLLDGKKNHIGQDMLSKLIERPFIYLSLSDGTYQKTYQNLSDALQKKDLTRLQNFPIKYILFRNDAICDNCRQLQPGNLDGRYTLVAKNKTFRLYRNRHYQPLVKGKDIQITEINPIEYKVVISHLSKQSIDFLMSYSKDWRLFVTPKQEAIPCARRSIEASVSSIQECSSHFRYSTGRDLKYLWQKQIFEDKHKQVYGYANSWNISAKNIKNNFSKKYYSMNKDGSINVSLTIFYLPQAWYILMWLISTTTLVIIVIKVLLRRLIRIHR